MDLFSDFEQRIRAALGAVMGDEALELARGRRGVSRVAAEPPRDPAHGDVATNAAMVLAKPLKREAARAGGEGSPRCLPPIPTSRRSRWPARASSTCGFPTVSGRQQPRAILKAGTGYGHSDAGGRRGVNVEFVSANPTGPMHVGHCRGAVVGDAIASLLAATGHAVTREYYINDAGAQVDQLARSAYLRYREALGEEIGEIPSGLYPGDYLKPVGAALKEEFGDGLLNLQASSGCRWCASGSSPR